MDDTPSVNDAPRTTTPDTGLDPRLQDPLVMSWMGEHMTELRQSVAKHRVRSQILWTAVLLGLVAHSAGYLIRASAANDLLRLGGDLLYTLGLALWTGVVVVVIVEIIPRAKERQIIQALDAYEAALHAQPRTQPPAPQAGRGARA